MAHRNQVHTTKGSANSDDRRDPRKFVKYQARKARRRSGKQVCQDWLDIANYYDHDDLEYQDIGN